MAILDIDQRSAEAIVAEIVRIIPLISVKGASASPSGRSIQARVGWPGLDGAVLSVAGKAVSSTTYTFQWLSSPGSLLLLSGDERQTRRE